MHRIVKCIFICIFKGGSRGFAGVGGGVAPPPPENLTFLKFR